MTDSTLDVPLAAVRQWTRQEFAEGEEAHERVTIRPWGFTVSRQSRAYLETGDILTMLVGGGPFIVDGESGEVWTTGSNPAEMIGDAQRPGWGALDDVDTFVRWRTRRYPGVANVLDAIEPAGADLRLLERYARWRDLLLPFREEGRVGWSDMEVGFFVELRDTGWMRCHWNRGHSQDQTFFTHRDDALRMLLLDVAAPFTRPGYEPRHPPVGLELFERDGRPALSWDEREAVFLRGRGDRERFLPFVRATLTDIEKSLTTPGGAPLIIRPNTS